MKQRGFWVGLYMVTLSLVLAAPIGVAAAGRTRWTRTLTGLVLTGALSGGFLPRALVSRAAVPGCGAFEEPTIVGTANADLDIRIITNDGELLRALTLNPERDCQARRRARFTRRRLALRTSMINDK